MQLTYYSFLIKEYLTVTLYTFIGCALLVDHQISLVVVILFFILLQVCEILMEWQWFTLYFNEDPDEIAHTEKMIDALLTQGFQPQSLNRRPLDRKDWKLSSHWPGNIVWVKTQC